MVAFGAREHLFLAPNYHMTELQVPSTASLLPLRCLPTASPLPLRCLSTAFP